MCLTPTSFHCYCVKCANNHHGSKSIYKPTLSTKQYYWFNNQLNLLILKLRFTGYRKKHTYKVFSWQIPIPFYIKCTIHNILFQLIYHVHLVELHRPYELLVHLAAYNKRHFTAYNFHTTSTSWSFR